MEKDSIDVRDIDKLIRGKNINFLIGAGASVPLYPSLSLGEGYPSFEDIVSYENIKEKSKKFMYIFYFLKWIEPMSKIDEDCVNDENYKQVINNYTELINIFYKFLQSESNEAPKRINIFTTNYDLLFEKTFDDFLCRNPLIYFNDGSRGVFKRYINNKNFYLNITHSGYNDNYKREVPTINLFKLHGSLSWELHDDKIAVKENNKKISDINSIMYDMELDYNKVKQIVDESKSKDLITFINNLNEKIEKCNLDDSLLNNFYDVYSDLAIINPDKFKFFKTVSEQHYYQLIRSFSYELEKKQSVLIVFGFSFADEHIRDIFERSLLNPELQVILITYNKNSQDTLKQIFNGHKNIMFLPKNWTTERGDFKYLLYILGGQDDE